MCIRDSVGTALTHFPLAGDVIELQPAVGTAVHDALGAQDHAVLAAVQLGQCMLDVCLAELLGRLDTPAGEHLIGIVIVVMVVVMAAAAVAVLIVVMMLMLIMVIVILMVVVVMAAVVLVVIILVVVVMLVLVLIIVVVIIVIMVVMAAAAHTVLIVMMVMMLVFFFLVLFGVLLIGLGSHSDQLCLEIVLGGHGLQDLLAGQGLSLIHISEPTRP